jgi:hypothetical protein
MVSTMQPVSLSYVPLSSCSECSQPLAQPLLGCRMVIVHPNVGGKIEHAFHYYCFDNWKEKGHTCASCSIALEQSDAAPPPSSHKRLDDSARKISAFFDAVVNRDERNAQKLVHHNRGLFALYKINALRLAVINNYPLLTAELNSLFI